MAACRCQNPNFGEIVLVSRSAEADRELAEESRIEKFAELFAGQAEILYRINGQLSNPNERWSLVSNQKPFELDELTSSVIDWINSGARERSSDCLSSGMFPNSAKLLAIYVYGWMLSWGRKGDPERELRIVGGSNRSIVIYLYRRIVMAEKRISSRTTNLSEHRFLKI